MLELLAFVILVAIFFGISVSAALNGVLTVFISIVAIWLLIGLLAPSILDAFEWNQERKKKQEIINQEKRKVAEAKRAAKKAAKQGKYPWGGAILAFVFMYLVTAIFMMLIGLIIEKIFPNVNYSMPEWLMLLLPATPFITLEIVAFIKKRARR